jgi:hypothetical protein
MGRSRRCTGQMSRRKETVERCRDFDEYHLDSMEMKMAVMVVVLMYTIIKTMEIKCMHTYMKLSKSWPN